jgi:hypothetical protein
LCGGGWSESFFPILVPAPIVLKNRRPFTLANRHPPTTAFLIVIARFDVRIEPDKPFRWRRWRCGLVPIVIDCDAVETEAARTATLIVTNQPRRFCPAVNRRVRSPSSLVVSSMVTLCDVRSGEWFESKRRSYGREKDSPASVRSARIVGFLGRLSCRKHPRAGLLRVRCPIHKSGIDSTAVERGPCMRSGP